MSEPSEDERYRLFALDAALRTEADYIMAQSGLGKIIHEAGFGPVGSYIMQTMTWRDLDFERPTDSPAWERHWELGTKLVKTGWVWRLRCLDAYRDPRGLEEDGYYWGLQVTDPQGGEIWKFDLWTARPEEFERAAPDRRLWADLLNDDTRCQILSIKEKVCHLPEYRQNLLSVHIYEAVLEHKIGTIDEFHEWWIRKYGKNTSPGEFWYR
jgi:hypothetical protein